MDRDTSKSNRKQEVLESDDPSSDLQNTYCTLEPAAAERQLTDGM